MVDKAKTDKKEDAAKAHKAEAKKDHKPAHAEAKAHAPKAKPAAEKTAEAKPAAKAEAPRAAKPAAAAAKPAPKARPRPRPRPVPKAAKKAKGGEDAVEIVDEAEEKAAKKHVAKAKPKLTKDVRKALAVRAESDEMRPTFYRQEWHRYVKFSRHPRWRRPRGMSSKARKHLGYRVNVVRVGYRGPKDARGLHPSGFEEVLVHNPKDLMGIDATRQAVRIGHGVGSRKRDAIIAKAGEKGIRVLNQES